MSSEPLASGQHTSSILDVSVAFDATEGGLAKLGVKVAEILGPTHCFAPGRPREAAGLPAHRVLRDGRPPSGGPVLYVVEAPAPALLHLSKVERGAALSSDPVAVRKAEELGVRLVELRVSNTVVSYRCGMAPFTVLTLLCFGGGMLISTVKQDELTGKLGPPYYPIWAYSCQVAVILALLWVFCGLTAHAAMVACGCCTQCCLPTLRLLQVPLLLTVAFGALGAGMGARRGFVKIGDGLAAVLLVPLYFALPVCYCCLAAAWGEGLNEVLDEDKLKYSFRKAGLLADDSPAAADTPVADAP